MEKKFEEKIELAKRKVSKTCKEVEVGVKKIGAWVRDNPREAIILATGLFTAAGAATKGAAKLGNMVQDAQDRKVESRRVWNPVDGVYLYTKKPMTGRQKLEFEQRVQSGESRASVLNSMGILDKRR